jgi:signal transduction histidine kinase
MIGRLVPRGLRGRLLAAFVLTSTVTLVVAAAVLYGPLQSKLRSQSVDNLRDAVLNARGDFADALGPEIKPDEPTSEDAPERAEIVQRRNAIGVAAFDLRQRIDVRVLVDADDADDASLPDFFYDSDFTPASLDATRAALQAEREDRTVTRINGDEVTVAVRLFGGQDSPNGVLVAQRRLTEVTAAVEQVRNALLVAAGIGLLVAIALGIALSTTLLRRLGRLRAVALRISAEGPDAPAPKDTGRDEVGDLARALARMQEELRRQEAARRSFVSTASHELRTPLTMLQGTMELLEEDLRDGRVDIEDAQLQVTNARRELRRLSALAGELLDLSRLDAAVQLRSEPVELGELGRAVAAEFHLRASELDVELEVLPPPEGCWGRGDPDAVARVVRILLDNALRYGPRGAPVSVEAHSTAGEARITVADRGAGIPPDERDRIFERFHRGGAAASSGGFGLGLAIGRELARRMGGELLVDGDGSDGTRFALTLRPARSPAEPPRGERDRVSA